MVSACVPFSKEIRQRFLKMIRNVPTKGYIIDVEFEKKMMKEWGDLDSMNKCPVFGGCKCCLEQSDLGRSCQTVGMPAGAE